MSGATADAAAAAVEFETQVSMVRVSLSSMGQLSVRKRAGEEERVRVREVLYNVHGNTTYVWNC